MFYKINLQLIILYGHFSFGDGGLFMSNVRCQMSNVKSWMSSRHLAPGTRYLNNNVIKPVFADKVFQKKNLNCKPNSEM